MKLIKVIGVGGIGTALLPFLCRYLNFEGEKSRIVLVDGDEFESKNANRQAFGKIGNKAKVKVQELAPEFDQVSFRVISEFVTAENIGSVISDGDVVFMGVDNHKTRKLVSDHCERLRSITLISGGNDLTDGNVQVYVKRDGRELSAPITRFHPEIETPGDKNPGEMSCDERARQISTRQIIVTNMVVASWMFAAFWLIEQGDFGSIGELYFDIVQGKTQRIERKAKGKGN